MFRQSRLLSKAFATSVLMLTSGANAQVPAGQTWLDFLKQKSDAAIGPAGEPRDISVSQAFQAHLRMAFEDYARVNREELGYFAKEDFMIAYSAKEIAGNYLGKEKVSYDLFDYVKQGHATPSALMVFMMPMYVPEGPEVEAFPSGTLAVDAIKAIYAEGKKKLGKFEGELGQLEKAAEKWAKLSPLSRQPSATARMEETLSKLGAWVSEKYNTNAPDPQKFQAWEKYIRNFIGQAKQIEAGPTLQASFKPFPGAYDYAA